MIFQDQLYVYGQISTSAGEEFEIGTMNSAHRFVLWTRIDQTAFQDGGGYGEEVEEDVKDRALLEMVEELVRRGRRDTTTLVNITVTVHFTDEFRFVAKFLWTMSAHMSISRMFLQAVYSISTCFY